ncbi:hypothetical protein GCM10010409_57000 [Mycolicibacterium diernhoferi]
MSDPDGVVEGTGAARGSGPRLREETAMTVLGASIYIGFFVLAALWLYLSGRREDQAQSPEDSNLRSVSAGSEGSSPWLVSHAASK